MGARILVEMPKVYKRRFITNDNHNEYPEFQISFRTFRGEKIKLKIIWLLVDTIRAAVPTSRNVSQKILWLGSKKS